MSKSIKNKYNRTGTGANQSVFGTMSGNTGIQEPVNTVKKKATFEIDSELHRRLRRHAADHDTTMVMILEKALTNYLDKQEFKK